MKQPRYRLLHFIPVILFGAYIFGFEYFPSQDYPQWLYQGFIFNEYFFHGNTFGGMVAIVHFIPPNLISTVIIGTLALFVPLMSAGKIFLLLELLLLYFG